MNQMTSPNDTTSVSSIPVNMLRQFLFCPRIPYFSMCLGLRPHSPRWVVQGSKYETMRHALLKARMPRELQKPDWSAIRFNVFLSSDSIGLHGHADAVVETSTGPVVLELKMNPSSIRTGAEVQLAAYSIMMDDRNEPESQYGYFIQGKPVKVRRLAISFQLRSLVISTASKIRSIVHNGTFPDSDAGPAKCSQCEYLNHCNDRD